MNDITIPADKAYQWALAIRNNQRLAGLDELANLLDPPVPSLRDEVADTITSRTGYGDKDDTWNKELADTVLAVVRRHVEAIYAAPLADDCVEFVRRDDVLNLFK